MCADERLSAANVVQDLGRRPRTAQGNQQPARGNCPARAVSRRLIPAWPRPAARRRVPRGHRQRSARAPCTNGDAGPDGRAAGIRTRRLDGRPDGGGRQQQRSPETGSSAPALEAGAGSARGSAPARRRGGGKARACASPVAAGGRVNVAARRPRDGQISAGRTERRSATSFPRAP